MEAENEEKLNDIFLNKQKECLTKFYESVEKSKTCNVLQGNRVSEENSCFSVSAETSSTSFSSSENHDFSIATSENPRLVSQPGDNEFACLKIENEISAQVLESYPNNSASTVSDCHNCLESKLSDLDNCPEHIKFKNDVSEENRDIKLEVSDTVFIEDSVIESELSHNNPSEEPCEFEVVEVSYTSNPVISTNIPMNKTSEEEQAYMFEWSSEFDKETIANIQGKLNDVSVSNKIKIIIDEACKVAKAAGVSHELFDSELSRLEWVQKFLNKYPDIRDKVYNVGVDMLTNENKCSALKFSRDLEKKILIDILNMLDESDKCVSPTIVYEVAAKVATTEKIFKTVFPRPCHRQEFIKMFIQKYPQIQEKMCCINEKFKTKQHEYVSQRTEENADPVEFEVFYVEPSKLNNHQEDDDKESNASLNQNFCSSNTLSGKVTTFLEPPDPKLVAELQGRRVASERARAKLKESRIVSKRQLKDLREFDYHKPEAQFKARLKKSERRKRGRRRTHNAPISPSDYDIEHAGPVSPPGSSNSSFEYENNVAKSEPLSPSYNIDSDNCSEKEDINDDAISKKYCKLSEASALYEKKRCHLKKKETIVRFSKVAQKLTPCVDNGSDDANLDLDTDECLDSDSSSVCSDISVDIEIPVDSKDDVEFKKRMKLVYFICTQAPHAVPCLCCLKIFCNVNRLLDHMKHKHVHQHVPAEKNFNCKSCGSLFGTKLFRDLHYYYCHDAYCLPKLKRVKRLDEVLIEKMLNYFNSDTENTLNQPSKINPEKKFVKLVERFGHENTILDTLPPTSISRNIFEQYLRDKDKDTESSLYKAKRVLPNETTERLKCLFTASKKSETFSKILSKSLVLQEQLANESLLQNQNNNETSMEMRSCSIDLTKTCSPSSSSETVTLFKQKLGDKQEPKSCFICKKIFGWTKLTPILHRTGSLSFCCPECLHNNTLGSQSQSNRKYLEEKSIVSYEMKNITHNPMVRMEVPFKHSNHKKDLPSHTSVIDSDISKSILLVHEEEKKTFVNKQSEVPSVSTMDNANPRPVALIFQSNNVTAIKTLPTPDIQFRIPSTSAVENASPRPVALIGVHPHDAKNLALSEPRQISKLSTMFSVNHISYPINSDQVNKPMHSEIQIPSHDVQSPVDKITNKMKIPSSMIPPTLGIMKQVGLKGVPSLKMSTEKQDIIVRATSETNTSQVSASLRIPTESHSTINSSVLKPLLKRKIIAQQLNTNLLPKEISKCQQSISNNQQSLVNEKQDIVLLQVQIIRNRVIQCSKCTKLVKNDLSFRGIPFNFTCLQCQDPKFVMPKVLSPLIYNQDYDFLCMYCRRSYFDAQTLLRHSNLCQTETLLALACPYCNTKFCKIENLATHAQYEHAILKQMKIQSYPCSICRYKFLSQVTLKTHFIVDHQTCNICNSKFETSKSCFEHMRVHLKLPTSNSLPPAFPASTPHSTVGTRFKRIAPKPFEDESPLQKRSYDKHLGEELKIVSVTSLSIPVAESVPLLVSKTENSLKVTNVFSLSSDFPNKKHENIEITKVHGTYVEREEDTAVANLMLEHHSDIQLSRINTDTPIVKDDNIT